MTDFEIVIGLEIHIQLDTASRLFSDEPAPVGQEPERPNARSGPYALGHPGTYPVLNGRAVRSAVCLGLAFDCRINPESGFDRKHYFYPDLPRGYQITQQRTPVCERGSYEPADAPDRGTVRIRSIHLEEDAGRLVHRADRTLVDYDRSGVPLLELVTEPDFRSPGDAADFLRDLRDIVRVLGIGDGRMEDGSIRCDANISVRRGPGPPGARVEIKNMNSFRHVEEALDYEAVRQVNVLSAGGSVETETRRFDANGGTTVMMRSKETAPDYRFIPDPDLPPVRISLAEIESAAANLPERPDRRRRRLREEAGLSKDWARMLAARPDAAELFENARLELDIDASPSTERTAALTRRMAVILVEDVLIGEHPAPPAQSLVDVAALVEDRRIDSDSTGALLDAIHTWKGARPLDAERLAESKGILLSSRDDRLDPFIQDAIREHPDEWRRYVSGKDGLLGFFVGRVLGALDDPADPSVVSDRIIAARNATASGRS